MARRKVRFRDALTAVLAFAGIATGITFAAQAATGTGGETRANVAKVYWSDGDSGRLSDGTRFRLHAIDAPETGSMKQRGGAKCESERALGYEAKATVLDLTRGKTLTVTKDYGLDRYKRLVLDLSVDGKDLAAALVRAGHHKPWDYDGGDPKPDWCGPSAPTSGASR